MSTVLDLCTLAFLSLLFATSVFAGPYHRDAVHAGCLGCICEASTGCNVTVGCNGDLCGLFAITKPFWDDANMPTIPLDEPHLEGAFERCVQDPVCATTSIRNYMERFAKDCNDDGKINCHDYARIHRFGPFDCEHELDTTFDVLFEPCMEGIGESYHNRLDSDGNLIAPPI